jgi:hypothetical protein
MNFWFCFSSLKLTRTDASLFAHHSITGIRLLVKIYVCQWSPLLASLSQPIHSNLLSFTPFNHSHSSHSVFYELTFKNIPPETFLYVGFEVLSTVVKNAAIFWDTDLCSPYVKRRFGGNYHLDEQETSMQQVGVIRSSKNVSSHTNYMAL